MHFICNDAGCEECTGDVDVDYSTKYVRRVVAGIAFSGNGSTTDQTSNWEPKLWTESSDSVYDTLLILDIGLHIGCSCSMCIA